MIYSYSNRRRAKDAVLALYGEFDDHIEVAVSSGLAYISTSSDWQEAEKKVILHFGEPVMADFPLLVLNWIKTGNLEEYYCGDAVRRFKA